MKIEFGIKDIYNFGKRGPGNKLPDVVKFILVYSCNVSTEDGTMALNQNAIAKFFNMTGRNMHRYFTILKDAEFITIVDKVRIQSARANNKPWFSNIYSVDQEAMNNYLIKVRNEDVLANIEKESKLYYDFLDLVYTDYAKYTQSSEEELTDIEKKVIERKVKRKVNREKKQLDNLKSSNSKYLEMLEKINNESTINMNYLNENKKRLTNAICGTKNPEKHPLNKERVKMLHDYFETDKNIVEFDTNASIYRLSYALGNECVASHSVDIYELIFNECDFDIEWTKELREQFKQLLMPIYMREWSINYKNIEFNKQSHWKYFLSKSAEKLYLFYKNFVTMLHRSLKDILTTICNAMHKVFNLEDFYKADIFIHESNLHILMINKFKNLGIKTIDVYDGFYFIEGTMTQELYDKIYDEATNELLDDYKKSGKL